MSRTVKPSSVEDTDAPADAPVAVDALSSDALARRRMLLKSLSKGSAVVAATALPIHSLAAPVTISTSDNMQCAVSGMGSAIHSNVVATGTCKGSGPLVYADPKKWPGYNPKNERFTVGSQTYGSTVRFRAVFGGNNRATLRDIMEGIDGVNSDRVWIAAWLNAGAGFEKPNGRTAKNFPYSPTEVVARYKNTSAGPEGNSQSFDFFTKYLQSL